MIVTQLDLSKRLGVSPTTLRKWTQKGFFGKVPIVGHPKRAQYDLDVVKASLEARKIRVAVGAFDVPPAPKVKPKTK